MRSQSRRRIAAAGLAGLAAGFAAPAASGSGAGPPPPPREINSLATEMSPRISRCLIRREGGLVERWLRTLPGSAEEARLVRSAEPRFPACFGEPHGNPFGVWLPKYERAGIRAALVRALLQARRGELPAAPAPGGASTWYSVPPGPPDTPADGAALVAAELGACLARKHWAEVLAIVRAVDPETEKLGFFTGSPKVEAAHRREAAAVDAELSKVIPSIPGCVPAGARLRMNRLRLRTLLEEAAYQMTARPAPPAAGARPFKAR
jgi:hypothetical protein